MSLTDSSSPAPTTFVYVHGGHESGVSFARVAARLRAEGHTVHTPDLPPNADVPIAFEDVTLDVYADHIAGIVEQAGEPVVLIGHSLGGLTISVVAERLPHLVRDIVYLSALMLPPGDTVLDFRRRFYGEQTPVSDVQNGRSMSADGKLSLLAPEGARVQLFNCCSLEDQEAGLARLRPQPQQVYYVPMPTTPERWGAIRRTYVLCLRDQGLPPRLSAFMLETVGADRVEVIDADHSSYLSATERLTKVMRSIAALPAPRRSLAGADA